jgi:hypothetical protein
MTSFRQEMILSMHKKEEHTYGREKKVTGREEEQ